MLADLLVLAAVALLVPASLLAALLLPFAPSSALRDRLPPKGGRLLQPRGPLRLVVGPIPNRVWILAPAISAAVFVAGARFGFAPLPADGSFWDCARHHGLWVPPRFLTDWTPAIAIVFGAFGMLVGVAAALLAEDPYDPRPTGMLLSAAPLVILGWTLTLTAYLGSLLPCA